MISVIPAKRWSGRIDLMKPSREEMIELLHSLRSELSKMSVQDPVQQYRVRMLEENIDKALSPKAEYKQMETLEHTLNDSIWSFEREHPEVTMLMSRVTDMLSSIGI